MGILDHWHPVLPVRALRRAPVGVRLCGHDLALFRAANGSIGAFDDQCPHRRMRLSLGSVDGDKLRCKYHGWTFAQDGQGESPGTPKLHACVRSFDTREAEGYIWVKPRGVEAAFPSFEYAGYLPMCRLEHRARAPLELAVDNFCEIEHTPTTHGVFGYELSRMREVTVRFETTDRTVRVINAGPPKTLGIFLDWLVGIRKNYVFNDDWTTHFSPVYSVYEHWWSDPATGQEAMVRWRLYIFFVPEDDGQTRIVTFAYGKSRYPGPAGGLRLARGVMRRTLDREVGLDVEILEGLASHDTGIEGMKLSRFDRALGLNRERIDRIYRGISPKSSGDGQRLPVECCEAVGCQSGQQ
jgi:phenylpropionate dioxygenase-like ring-hydroxylating dioxygenase large terminal subunit